MVLMKFDSSIVSIRGRMGGVYFKHGKDGQHMQAMPRHVNYARSPAQQGSVGEISSFGISGIKGYSFVSVLWQLALMIFYGALWTVFAGVYAFTKKDDDPKKITGWNWAIHYALAFPEEQRPPYWKPPPNPDRRPQFIATFRGLLTYNITPEERVPKSPTSYYWLDEPFNGQNTYHSDTYFWWLWFKDPQWVLSSGVGQELPGFVYYNNSGVVIGDYIDPFNGDITNIYFGGGPFE